MTQQLPSSPSLSTSYLRKYRSPILISLAAITIVMILVSPIVPVRYTVAKTRTRNLRYSSDVYGIYNVPKTVKVTNQDSVGGSFSVTMSEWSSGFANGQPTRYLVDTFSQSLYIGAGETQTFNLPDDWAIISPLYSLTYSVSAPSTQEDYQEQQTEYKSILTLVFGSR